MGRPWKVQYRLSSRGPWRDYGKMREKADALALMGVCSVLGYPKREWRMFNENTGEIVPPDEGRTMNEPTIFVDMAEKDRDIPGLADAPKACPRCGCERLVCGFGLAGGGYGPYLCCDDCSTVVAKNESEE